MEVLFWWRCLVEGAFWWRGFCIPAFCRAAHANNVDGVKAAATEASIQASGGGHCVD